MSTSFEKVIWQSGNGDWAKAIGTVNDDGTITAHLSINFPTNASSNPYYWKHERTIYNSGGEFTLGDQIPTMEVETSAGSGSFTNGGANPGIADSKVERDRFTYSTKTVIYYAVTSGHTTPITINSDCRFRFTLPNVFTIDTYLPVNTPTAISFSPSSLEINGTNAITATPNFTSTDATYVASLSLNGYSASIPCTDGSFSYAVPMSFIQGSMPDSITGDATITVSAYYGNVKLKDYTGTITLTVPASCVPVVNSATIIDYLGKVPSAWNEFLQYVSAFKVSALSVAESYGSVVNKVDFSVGSLSASGTKDSLPQLTAQQESGTLTATITLTDTRGRTGTYTTQLTVATYSPPSFNNVASYRSKQDGTKDSNGLYGLAETSINFTSLGGKNSATLKVSYKKSSESTYGTETAIAVGSSVFGGDLSLDDAYDVKYTLSDLITSVVYLDYISSASYLISLLKGGNGIAFGIKAETANLIEMGFSAKFDHAVTFTTSKGNEVTIQQIIDALNLDP